jgi:hypothetical protein
MSQAYTDRVVGALLRTSASACAHPSSGESSDYVVDGELAYVLEHRDAWGLAGIDERVLRHRYRAAKRALATAAKAKAQASEDHSIVHRLVRAWLADARANDAWGGPLFTDAVADVLHGGDHPELDIAFTDEAAARDWLLQRVLMDSRRHAHADLAAGIAMRMRPRPPLQLRRSASL